MHGAVYAAGLPGLYVSKDHGARWQALPIEASGVHSVLDLAADPRHEERLYAASFEGSGRSLDGGVTWTRVTAGTLLDGQACTSVTVSPFDSSLLYVGTYSGVFRSRDGGTTWEPFSAGFNQSMITDVLADPHDPRLVYAATQFTGVDVIEQTDVAAAPTPLPSPTPPPRPTQVALHSSSGGSGCAVGADANGAMAPLALLVIALARRRLRPRLRVPR